MRLILIIIISFLSVNGSQANSNWRPMSTTELSDLYVHIGEYYKKTNTYFLSITHKSYSDYKSIVPRENLSGYYFKDGKSFEMNLFDNHIVQKNNVRLTIQGNSNEILINDAQEDLTVNVLDRQKSMSRFIQRVEQKEFGDVTEVNVYYDSKVPYQKVYMRVNADGFITKMVLYFANSVEWEDSNGKIQESKPRIEIDYHLEPSKIDLQRSNLKMNNYVMDLDKAQITSAPKFNNYILRDLRIK